MITQLSLGFAVVCWCSLPSAILAVAVMRGRCSAVDWAAERSARRRRRRRQLRVPSQRSPGTARVLAARRAPYRRRPPALHRRGGAARRVPAAHRAGQGYPRRRQRHRVCGRERHRRPGLGNRPPARLPRRTRFTCAAHIGLDRYPAVLCCQRSRSQGGRELRSSIARLFARLQFYNEIKKRSERRKHCALAVSKAEPKIFAPPQTPGRAKI